MSQAILSQALPAAGAKKQFEDLVRLVERLGEIHLQGRVATNQIDAEERPVGDQIQQEQITERHTEDTGKVSAGQVVCTVLYMTRIQTRMDLRIGNRQPRRG